MGASALRVARVRIVAGGWLKIASGKLLYLGKGFRVILGEGASIDIGGGHLFEPWLRCASWRASEPGAGGRRLHDEGCRVTAVESVRVGADALFGSSVQVCKYGHDRKFYRGGSARSCDMCRFPSGDADGCTPTRSSREAASMWTARSSRRTSSPCATFPKRVRCTPVHLRG